ncbi:MAG: SDR family NAD(P)-dependent oxidoreductase, partial [bacterium]|nr:SDR family NAD(P)-dependent oxidoreductase [bacterium]
MDYELQGKTAIVTGGTSGIGLEIARIFTEGGARVAITGRNEEKMGRVVEDLEGNPGEITGIRMDLESRDDMDRLMEETESRFGPLDILVNNAGRSYPGKFFETGPELWETILRNRIVNPLYLTQKALAGMAGRGRGSVTFMSAVISKEPIAENV